MEAINNRYNRVFGLDDPRFTKLQDAIAGGKEDAVNVMEGIEKFAPMDKIVPAKNIDFDVKDGKVVVGINGDEMALHRNAISQMVGKTDILTAGVSEKMLSAQSGDEKWGQDLLLYNLRTIFSHFPANKRFLVRSVSVNDEGRQEVRGFLSDSYRRMNVGPIFQEFAQVAINAFGAIPMRVRDGHSREFNSSFVHDLKMGLSLYLPHVFQPIEGRDEFVVLGVTVQNSDFGAGALVVSMQCLRIFCSNLTIFKDELRKIHLGSRLSEDMRFANDTYEADTKAMSLAVRDITKGLFSAPKINEYNDKMNRAANENIDPDVVFSKLRTAGHLTKDEEKEIKGIFSSAEIQDIPAGQNMWRAAQSVSLFANLKALDGKKERANELRQSSGYMIDEMMK